MTKFIVIGFCVLYYAATLFLIRSIRFTTKGLCLCGITVAMTLVLDSIRIPLPTGATFSLCSPLPLMVLAIMTDHRLGFISGWGAWGYSLAYNLSQNVPLCTLCGIIVMALPLKVLRKAASGR